MGVFYLFTLARGAARLGEAHINWVNLLFQSKVTRTGLTILLPTCDPDDLDPDFFEGWLAAIQGPIVTAAADDNDDQCAFLLCVVLTYRAFATHHPDLTIGQYVSFTTMFVVGALALNPDEDAASAIAEIDQWMTDNIPLEILEPRDLPPRTEEQFNGAPVAWRFPGHRVVMTDGWTSPVFDPSTRGETIHILSTGATSPRLPAVAEGSSSRAPIPAGSEGATGSASTTCAVRINGASVDDAGYDSDSSMPGLKTPSDGSDSGY